MAWPRMPAIDMTDRQRAYLGMAKDAKKIGRELTLECPRMPAIDKTDSQRTYLGMAKDAGHR